MRNIYLLLHICETLLIYCIRKPQMANTFTATSLSTVVNGASSRQKGPILARRCENRRYFRQDNISSRLIPIGNGSISGKVKVDVLFRFKESLWGVLGPDRHPAGIIYCDITFHNPEEYHLQSAIVKIKVDDDHDFLARELYNHNAYPYVFGNGALTVHQIDSVRLPVQMTEYFGPKNLCGERRAKMTTKTKRFVPELHVMGYGFGGAGQERETISREDTRWKFCGELKTDRSRESSSFTLGNMHWLLCNTLEWKLTENSLEKQASHNNTFKTGFCLDHGGRFFFLTVEVEGKLARKSKRDRVLGFCRKGNTEDNQVTTLVDFGGMVCTKSLDEIAKGLEHSMTQANQNSTAIEMQECMPATFSNIPGNGFLSQFLGSSNRSNPFSQMHTENSQIPLSSDSKIPFLDQFDTDSPLHDTLPQGPSLEELQEETTVQYKTPSAATVQPISAQDPSIVIASPSSKPQSPTIIGAECISSQAPGIQKPLESSTPIAGPPAAVKLSVPSRDQAIVLAQQMASIFSNFTNFVSTIFQQLWVFFLALALLPSFMKIVVEKSGSGLNSSTSTKPNVNEKECFLNNDPKAAAKLQNCTSNKIQNKKGSEISK